MTTALRGLTWDHPRGLDSVRRATDRWSETHGGVEVIWDARSLRDFGDESLAARAQHYDLLVIDHPHIPAAVAAGWLLPLDGAGHDAQLDVLAGQSVGASHASYQHDGRQYALAVDAAAQVAAYRPDLLPERPTTWTEVIALAAEGRVLWPATPVDAMASFLTLAAQRGNHLVADGDVISQDAARGALDQLLELAALVPTACLQQNPIDIAERLSVGDVWCYAPLIYGYSNYCRAGFRPHRLRYVDLPADDTGSVAGSCLGGAGIAVSAATREPALATELAFWLSAAEVQAGCYFEAGGQPGNAVAWEDDSCNAATLDFFRGTRATLDGASVRPRAAGWPAVQAQIGVLVNRCLCGDLSAEEAVSAIRVTTEQMLMEVRT